jgi:alpha-tubulin suppressor-like RCC1 family protein
MSILKRLSCRDDARRRSPGWRVPLSGALMSLLGVFLGIGQRSEAQSPWPSTGPAKDIIGWGVMEFDTRETATYRTSTSTEVFQVSCGGGHTLALRLDPSIPTVAPCTPLGTTCDPQEGVVMAWGFNDFGQSIVGLETTASGDVRPWTATQVAAGYSHSMILRPDGSVFCWGDNSFGQCTPPREASNPVKDGSGVAINPVVEIAAGSNFSLALLKDGKLLAWGDNTYGQLNVPVWPTWVAEGGTGYDPGHPGSATNSSFNGKSVRFYKIAAGGEHVVALAANNQASGDFSGTASLSRRVMAWGRNDYGQCQVGSNPGAALTSSQMFSKLPATQWPVPLSSVDQKFKAQPMLASQISAGQFHSLVLTGQLPVARYYKSKQPNASNTDAPYEAINSTFPLVFGSGSNVFGQATIPTMRATNDPFYRNWQLSAPIKWVAIAAGGYHSMAVSSTGFVYCWGQGAKGYGLFGDFGQVNDDPEKELAKQRVDFYQPQPGILCDVANQFKNTRLVSAGLYHSAAVSLQWDLKPTTPPGVTEPVNVAVTWGRNGEAQCGVPYETNYSLMRNIAKAGTMSRMDRPAIVKKISAPSQPRSRYTSDIRAVWAGGFMPNREYGFYSDFVIGLNRLGLPVGLGDNTNSQRTFFFDDSPVITQPSLKYSRAAAGSQFSWLLSTDSRPYFFGDAFTLYAGESDTPDVLPIVEISAGAFHTLFRAAGGSVYATGGRAATYFDEKLFEEVQVNWGQGSEDMFGNFLGGDITTHTRTLNILANKVSAGWFHSAAVLQTGQIACWGAGDGLVADPGQVHRNQSVVPAGLTGCTDVAAGGYHTVALTSVNPTTGVGIVRGWGSNLQSQSALNGIVSAATCPNAVVIRRADGQIAAWGNPSPEADDITVGDPDTASIFAGYGSTGFIDRSGQLQVFGDLLGTTVPVDPATGLSIPLRSVAFGEDHVVGIRTDGTVFCWGNAQCNEYLQSWLIDKDPCDDTVLQTTWLARNTLGTLLRPGAICPTTSPLCERQPYEYLVRRSYRGEIAGQSTPRDPTGIVLSRGVQPNIDPPNPWFKRDTSSAGCDLGPTDRPLLAIQVAAGRYHSIALRADGTLQAWGATTWLDPSEADSLPVVADVVKNTPGAFGFAFTKVAASTNHNIALRIDGSATVWGNVMLPDQEYGVLKPKLGFDITLLSYGVADVACGERHAVILRSNGEVVAWGDEVLQQDGSWTRPNNSPASVPAGQRALSIAAGGDNTVVISDALTPLVFGGLEDVTKPTITDTTLTAVAVRAGGFHSLALQSDGTVVGWGAGRDINGGSNPYLDQDSSNFPQYGQADVPLERPNYLAPITTARPISSTNPSPFAAGALTSVAVLEPLSIMGARARGGLQELAPEMPDLDGDGCVTTDDLSILLLEFGNAAWPGADLDDSGEIDMGDVAILQMSLGDCVGTPVEVEIE